MLQIESNHSKYSGFNFILLVLMVGPLSNIIKEVFVEYLFCFLLGLEDAQR